MHRILVIDPIHAAGLDLLREAPVEVHLLDESERPRLPELIAEVDAVVVRSATRLGADLLRHGERLRVARPGVRTEDTGHR